MKNKETLEDASLRIGLMEIELNHTKTLLASCEKALENRDNQAKKMYSEEEVELILNFVNDNYYKDGNGWIPNYKDDWITTKELLEIFKNK
jgi:hypothetical protein